MTEINTFLQFAYYRQYTPNCKNKIIHNKVNLTKLLTKLLQLAYHSNFS